MFLAVRMACMSGPRFQFSIRQLLVATTVVAAAVGALAAAPSRFSGVMLILLAAAFPTVFAAALIGKSGIWKAFCAGAIIPAGVEFISTMGSLSSALCPPPYPVPPVTQPGLLDAWENAATGVMLRSNTALHWIAMLTVGLMSAGLYGLARVNSPQGDERKARRASLVRLAMFWLVLAAIAIGVLAAAPSRYSGCGIMLLVCAFPAAFAAGLVGSQGAAKAFCAAALLPAGVGCYMAVTYFYAFTLEQEVP